MANIFLLMFTLWLAIKGSVSVDTLESIPPSMSGVLTACAGQKISLTCRNNISTDIGITFWEASSPVNCERAVFHLPDSPASACGPFMFEGITRVPVGAPPAPVLNSTAVATAAANMTNTTVDCKGGIASAPVSVGNISLCILAPPTNIMCQNNSNELRVTWDPVLDPTSSCAMSGVNYSVTITRESDMMMVLSTMVPATQERADPPNTMELDLSARYLITVSAQTTNGMCMGQQVNVTCDTPPSTSTESPPSPPTTIPVSTTVASSQSTSTPPPSTTRTSQPSSPGLAPGIIAAIAVVVIVLVFLVIVIVIVVVIILMMSSKGKNNGRGGVHAPLATDPEHDSLSGQQQAPVYAMVDKSKKTAHAEQPTYQDPATIQHETAESGDLYAVSEKKGKAAKPGPEVAELYSEVDKSNKNEEGLTYASIEVDAKNAKKKPGGQPQEPQEPVLYSDIQLQH